MRRSTFQRNSFILSFFYVVNLFKTPASNTDYQSKTQSNVYVNQHVVIEKNTAIFQIQIVQKWIKKTCLSHKTRNMGRNLTLEKFQFLVLLLENVIYYWNNV